MQMKDVENLITKKPDCIIIDTCDSDAIVSSIEDCNKAGIPVLTWTGSKWRRSGISYWI